MQPTLAPILEAVEKYCTTHAIEHRFVGGVSYGGILNESTDYTISIADKTIHLRGHNSLLLKRDDNTIRDIDMIVLSPDKAAVEDLKQFVKTLPTRFPDVEVPPISIEAAIYPSWGKHNGFFQFVTALIVERSESYGSGDLYLSFDRIKQKISWESIARWTLVLENGLSYSVRHPYADYLAYHFRVPSGIKPKDKGKVSAITPLVSTILAQGERHGIDYDGPQYFGSWKTYIRKLHRAGGLTRLKAAITHLYWSSLGTDIAHGKGPIAKFMLQFANQFTGVKQ